MHKPQLVRHSAPRSLWALLVPTLLSPALAFAQEPPPPPPPPPAPEGSGYGWEVSSEASAEASAEPTAEPTAEPDAGPGAEANVDVESATPAAEGASTSAELDSPPVFYEGEADQAPEDPAVADEYASFRRAEQLRAHNSLRASTGLLRVREAGSGPVGSFRFGLYAGLYAGSGFLCTSAAPCFDRLTGARRVGDDVDRMAANLTLSATPWPFLEAFLGLYNTSSSNSLGRPQLLQVLGDANLGVKVFKPTEADEIFSYGGEAELLLLNGTGGVGVHGASTGFAVRALGTMDLNNRRKPEDRFPLRAHVNLGYVFDNSAQVVRDLENDSPPSGRGAPIDRVERFGLGISRVDAFQIGLGAEYQAKMFRPFAEWTLDVPVNRQGYVCNIQDAARRGDLCLGVHSKLSAMPSRFSLGTRIYPWQTLAVTAAVDLATGGSSRFLEEALPEVPYTVWVGLAYAVDTAPPLPRETIREAAGGLRRHVQGRVVETSDGAPVPDAVLHYEGQERTGMVAIADGAFRTDDLPPGHYVFSVSAEGYKPATCEVTVPTSLEDAAPSAVEGQPAPSPSFGEAGELLVPVECQLAPLPKVATITGLLVDAVSGEPIARATVKITDKLGRELELTADDAGAFQFRNVPFGRATVTATGAGYLTTAVHFNIESRKEIEARLSLNKRPSESNVEVTDKELKLKRQVHFLYNSAAILPDSLSILEEIAEALEAHQELVRIEIQGHTDTTGQADYNRRLSHERAEAVKRSLVQLGVAEDRLVAKGYGPDKPLVPNSNNENRARNRRVQLMVLERSEQAPNW